MYPIHPCYLSYNKVFLNVMCVNRLFYEMVVLSKWHFQVFGPFCGTFSNIFDQFWMSGNAGKVRLKVWKLQGLLVVGTIQQSTCFDPARGAHSVPLVVPVQPPFLAGNFKLAKTTFLWGGVLKLSSSKRVLLSEQNMPELINFEK